MLNKYQWKRLIKKKISDQNKSKLLDMAKKYKKIDYNQMKLEECELKDYLININQENPI